MTEQTIQKLDRRAQRDSHEGRAGCGAIFTLIGVCIGLPCILATQGAVPELGWPLEGFALLGVWWLVRFAYVEIARFKLDHIYRARRQDLREVYPPRNSHWTERL